MDVVSDDSHSAQNPQVESSASYNPGKSSKGIAGAIRWATGSQEMGNSKQQSNSNAESSLVHSHFFNGKNKNIIHSMQR